MYCVCLYVIAKAYSSVGKLNKKVIIIKYELCAAIYIIGISQQYNEYIVSVQQ